MLSHMSPTMTRTKRIVKRPSSFQIEPKKIHKKVKPDENPASQLKQKIEKPKLQNQVSTVSNKSH